MTELVTRNFWWPGVTKEVKKYVEGCNVYQRNKNRTEAPTEKLMLNVVPEKPWTHISADFITKLLLAQGYDSILVVCNRITKIAYFVLTTEKALVEEVTRLFQDNIWKLHGLPESIIMDRGAQFAAGMMKELNQMLGIDTRLSMAYYSVTNFIRPYLYQFFDDSHSLNSTQKPLKRPFDWYQSHLKAINNGRDIRKINW